MKFIKTTQDKIVAAILLLITAYLCWATYDYKTSETKRIAKIQGSQQAVDELTKTLFNSTYPNIKRIGISSKDDNTLLIFFRAGTDPNNVKALFPDNKYKECKIEFIQE